MTLDFDPLQSAINQLEKSLGYAHSPMAENEPDLFEQFRNSVIQCFEFTYELSHRMLKRYLEATAASPDEDDLSTFQNLIRTGNEKGLLRSDWSRWRVYLSTQLFQTFLKRRNTCMNNLCREATKDHPDGGAAKD